MDLSNKSDTARSYQEIGKEEEEEEEEEEVTSKVSLT